MDRLKIPAHICKGDKKPIMEMRTTDTKERLIKAALDLFSENGYEKTYICTDAGALTFKLLLISRISLR